ncbi:MAG: TonB family protein [Myxococcaceae bacterium]|nr:TonB family protein [Myxococcaceae bacterium]
MFEIWWKDRLIDVVPAVGELPDGLTVKSRAAGPAERIAAPPPDWRFPKVVALCLLGFIACVMVMALTPVGEGGLDDRWVKPSMVLTHVVVPPKPPKSLPTELKARAKELFASATVRPNQKMSVGSMIRDLDFGGPIGGGSSTNIDVLLDNLSPGGGGGDDRPGFGGSRGPGSGGIGPGLGYVGAPGGRRPGPGGADLGSKRESGPTTGPVRISDGLPRDLVAKVIRAHFNEIKYCYERELQHSPGLSGKVGIAFTIGPAGEVIEAAVSESTLGNDEVETCMLSRVKRWRFAEPQGGGTVEVNHPWIFRGAGDNDP